MELRLDTLGSSCARALRSSTDNWIYPNRRNVTVAITIQSATCILQGDAEYSAHVEVYCLRLASSQRWSHTFLLSVGQNAKVDGIARKSSICDTDRDVEMMVPAI